MWIFLSLSILGFWFAGAIVLYGSPLGIVDLIWNNIWILGTITSGTTIIGLSLAKSGIEMTESKIITLDERKIYNESLIKLRGLRIFFFLLFGICFSLTPLNQLESWFTGHLVAASIFACSLILLGLAVLSNSMAKTIRVRFLNTQGESN